MDKKDFTLDQLQDTYTKVGSLKQILYDWHGHNETLFTSINSIHNNMYDKAMIWLTNVGDHHLFLYYFLALSAFALFSIIIRKLSERAGMKSHISQWIGVITVLMLGYATMGITVKTLKNEMAYERPYAKITSQKVVVLERQPGFKATQSFPSGHSAFTAFMVTALWPILPVLLRWAGVLLIFGIGWSRVAVGVHFPADVFWGIMIGIVTTWLVRQIAYSLYRRLLNIHCTT